VYLSVNRKIVFVWLILCLGDLPRVINAVMSVFSVKLYNLNEFGIESWSNMENLFWVPNQVIPSLILGGMFMHTLLRRTDISAMVLPIALSFWWAAFPAFVCGLLVAILVIREWILVRFNISWSMAVRKVLLPFAVCVPVLILFLSHEKIPVSGFLWDFESNLADTVKEYLTNIIVNVAMFLGLYMLVKRKNEAADLSVLFYTIILLSLTVPLYRMGEVNDFLIRGMMPVLVIIGIYLLEPFSRLETKQMFSYAKSSVAFMVIFFLLGCSTLSGTGRLWRAARVNRIADPTFTPISYDAYPNVYEALKGKWSQEGADQYMGDRRSFYENYIAP
ncbi:MAG TPA: hypothetical protein VGN64_13130, partial [Dyadobacter sp.]|nr:hypothetical protein [Dyadobacter sp.]